MNEHLKHQQIITMFKYLILRIKTEISNNKKLRHMENRATICKDVTISNGLFLAEQHPLISLTRQLKTFLLKVASYTD